MSSTGFSRVSKKHPCEICGKPDWCTEIDDGRLAYCMRQSFGSIKQGRSGGYIHVLRETLRPVIQSTKTASAIRESGSAEGVLAGANRRDAVYRELLENLTLTEAHGNHLLQQRQLSDTTIARNLYASIPSDNGRIVCKELARHFDLSGVPGFYKEHGLWRLNVFSGGFFIPYRDIKGKISALQVRRDSGSPRYLWLSSNQKPRGASSRAPIHFNRPDLATVSGVALMTEGALKADCIADNVQISTIAVAGVSGVAPDTLTNELRQNLPELKKIILAFDIDWKTNVAVRNALARFVCSFSDAYFDVQVLKWNANLGKGLDDVLLKGN